MATVCGILPAMESCPFEFARENCPLAPLTLYKVGGPARLALFPRNAEEAVEAVDWMHRQPGPKIVLGGGSNVLVADAGFPGIALITTELCAITALGEDRFRVEGGVWLGKMVREVMVPANYAGVGALTGIPGSVGGAIYMNAGTVNGSTCELLESVDLVDAQGVRTVPMEPALYGYRGQSFCPPQALILAGTFRFERADEDQAAIHEHYLRRRIEKQPQGNCCGSVFKNPPGDHAGRLIEACGLKGTRLGGAMVSDMHANFIMNDQNATASDIRGLIERCREAVRERFGITLDQEVVFIGH
jgi:UDP-N-acetylmuramate dehydrogenase